MYTYYYFKFDPQTDEEFKEVTDFITYFKQFDVVQFSQRKIMSARSETDVTDLLIKYAKKNFTQKLEIEVQKEEPREAFILHYNPEVKGVVTQYILPLFNASYLFDTFSGKNK